MKTPPVEVSCSKRMDRQTWRSYWPLFAMLRIRLKREWGV